MALISDSISKLRGNRRLLQLPPYLSFLCILGGVVWILLLPLNQYSRNTYISENALLPGQVHTYYTGTEQNFFRAYRRELGDAQELEASPPAEARRNGATLLNAKIEYLFKTFGLKTASQHYNYSAAGVEHSGENIYSVLHAPRADATEAIVLAAALKNARGENNINGVALLVGLSRYFRRWSLWSKDIIFLVTPESFAGPQAWIDAYHSTHDSKQVGELPLKSGALQGGVCIDFPFDHRFDTLQISYNGVNGQLPNLDLINTAVSVATGQMGIGTAVQNMFKHDDSYKQRLQTLLRGMSSQALGHATGPHSVFMPYHIDAITLTTVGDGWQDEMAFGRTIESICRSLNNLLEHLHQSFFFYLLMQTNRFVSIGTYLPSAMAVGASFTIMAIYLWATVPVGKAPPKAEANGRLSSGTTAKAGSRPGSHKEEALSGSDVNHPQVSKSDFTEIVFPALVVVAVHAFGYASMLNLAMANSEIGLYRTFVSMTVVSSCVPLLLAMVAIRISIFTERSFTILRSLMLLLLGLSLSTLATLNFSLSMILGLLCTPLAFVKRSSKSLGIAQLALLLVLSPGFLPILLATIARESLSDWLYNISYAWTISGSWGVPIGVLSIWLPAWIISAFLVATSTLEEGI